MISIGSDHAGYQLKLKIEELLDRKGLEFTDVGTFSEDSCDYPDIAALVSGQVAGGMAEFGILVCGTGIGMSIAANRNPKIRAAVCFNEYTAQITRNHNDANVLCLGARTTEDGLALRMVEIFLGAPFEGGQHSVRIDKLMGSIG